ncbi:hypothetical protein SAY87_006335 [Trapa incisa]|uniref:NAC domain-containing protein n=1 Tax=Trapa incisa TaxID=236973 RepID=A0AAN7JWF0_9MYRT|nr:hypothetical protein SAY87_006335 [Trapa incisa]
MTAADLQLPPGFRFHPTDEELVMHYLVRRCASHPIAVPIIAEIDLYKFDPWELPGKALYGEKEWYFFSPRDRKYPNGSRPNRAAGTGYWKATGADKPIGTPKPVGIKKALVFYAGKAPKGDKTNWIMHEYRLADVDRSARKKNSLRLDDWVLCRIYNKKGAMEKRTPPSRAAVAEPPPSEETGGYDELEDTKPSRLALLGCRFGPAAMLPPPHPVPAAGAGKGDFMHFDTTDSVPRLHTDSSCSEHVLSPEFTCEVQSEPKLRSEWDRMLDFGSGSGGFMDAMDFGGVPADLGGGSQLSPLQDMFMYHYLQKPF